MSEYFDAVVFIDRHEAKVFHFGAKDEVQLALKHTSAQRKHHEAQHEDGTRHAVDDAFLRTIVASLDDHGSTLLVGPGNSKFELQAYIKKHEPDIAERIAGVETLESPKDSGILALAREFFRGRGHRQASKLRFDFRHNDLPDGS